MTQKQHKSMVLRWRNYLLTRVAYSGSYYQGVGLSVLLPYEMLQVSKASGHFDFDAWWCITSTHETIIHVNLCMPCLHIQFPHKDHAKCFIWKQKQHRFLLVNPTMNNYVVELFVVVVVFFFFSLHFTSSQSKFVFVSWISFRNGEQVRSCT